MLRRFLYNRWGAGSAYGYRRRPVVFDSYTAAVLIVSAGVLLVLYLLGYLDL